MKTTAVEISTTSIIKIILLLISLIFLWQIRFILLLLLTSYIFMAGFAQLADYLQKGGFSKTAAAVTAYLLSIFVIFVVVFLVIPPLTTQLKDFFTNLPDYFQRLNAVYKDIALPGILRQDLPTLFSNGVSGVAGNFFSIIVDTFNFLLNFLTVAIISFFLLLDRDKIKANLFRLFPSVPKDRVTRLAHKIESQLGGWLKGELILTLIVGLATYIGLFFLKVDYALPLAVIAGVLVAIPIIGPILASIPAVIITFTFSPIAAIGVVLLYILIQQIETSFLVPKIMKEVNSINPILIIVSILVGANFFGILGVVLSVPIAVIVQVIILDLIENPLKN